MQFVCSLSAVCMQFICSLYAVYMQFICSSYAVRRFCLAFWWGFWRAWFKGFSRCETTASSGFKSRRLSFFRLFGDPKERVALLMVCSQKRGRGSIPGAATFLRFWGTKRKKCVWPGLNWSPCAYESDALPLGHRAMLVRMCGNVHCGGQCRKCRRNRGPGAEACPCPTQQNMWTLSCGHANYPLKLGSVQCPLE